MLLDKFANFVVMIQNAIGLFLPSDLVLWIGALIVVIFVLAAWRMIH